MAKWRYERGNEYDEDDLSFDDEYTTFEKIKNRKMKEEEEAMSIRNKVNAKKRFNNYKEY